MKIGAWTLTLLDGPGSHLQPCYRGRVIWPFNLAPRLDFIDAQLASILAAVTTLQGGVTTMAQTIAQAMAALQSQVAANTSAEASAVTLIQGIASQLAAANAANDPNAVAALTAQLQTSCTSLAAAVVANTPSAQPVSS